MNKQEQAETIYMAYPRKVAKKAAIEAILRALKRAEKEGTSFDEILNKTVAWKLCCAGTEKHLVPHPSTWFNRGSYTDDPQEWGWKKSTPNTGRFTNEF
jgi:hypothetical protein